MQWKKVMAFINILAEFLFFFPFFFCRPSETKLNKQMKKWRFIHTIKLLVPNTFLMIQLSSFLREVLHRSGFFFIYVSLVFVIVFFFKFKLTTQSLNQLNYSQIKFFHEYCNDNGLSSLYRDNKIAIFFSWNFIICCFH